MWDAWGVDDVTWGALTLTLTLLGRSVDRSTRSAGAGSRRVCAAPASRCCPRPRWMTGTLEMFTDIGGAVADWATHLVFSPVVWAGIVLAGISVLLFGASGAMRERGRGGKPGAARRDAEPQKREEEGAARQASGRGAPAIDDDMADIEALLRKRGIT